MKRIISYLIMFVAGLFFLSSPTHAESVADKNKQSKSSFQFINTAQLAVLDRDPASGGYRLTLQKANPLVSYIKDRPSRVAGSISLKEFQHEWSSDKKNGFCAINPNASISAIIEYGKKGEQLLNFPVQLKKLKLNLHSKLNLVEYNFLPIGDISKMPQKLPALLKYATIFIDDLGACFSCR